MKLQQDFGNIYGGKNPSHGVYFTSAIEQHGERATAISHHWSEASAVDAATAASELNSRACVAVEYIKKQPTGQNQESTT